MWWNAEIDSSELKDRGERERASGDDRDTKTNWIRMENMTSKYLL